MYSMNNNQIRSDNSDYSCSLMQDPYKMQYLACLHKFNTEEIPDGYSVDEIEEMIEFLVQVQQELKFKNNCLMTPPLYSGTLE